MTGLLHLLREHGDVVEADLSRYHHLRYSDRWRRDADGFRRLTLREIAVRVHQLPVDSATSMALGNSGWRLEHFLAAHLFQAQTGNPHPALPTQSPIADPVRAKQMRDAKSRARERQRAIDAGEIT